MKVPYVHSNFERVENDFYPTIDPRCINSFLHHFNPSGECIDVCAPSGSGIVDTLKENGYRAYGIGDAFADKVVCNWIVTNPPYDRKVVDKIIWRQINRIESSEAYGLAVLLRANFDFAKSRADMFDSRFYYGQIRMRFRPWWSEDHKAQPIHNFVWHIWSVDINYDYPIVLYSDGVKR